MNCPICQNDTIEGLQGVCPQCQTNLDAFYHIDSIDKKLKQLKKNKRWLVLVLCFLLIGWGLSSYYYNHTLQQTKETASIEADKEAQQNKIEEDLKNENIQLKTTINELEEKVKELELSRVEEVSVNSIQKDNNVHVVEEGETLWLLAEKYLGSGFKYKTIASDNNISDPNILYKGLEIKINQH